MNSNTMLDVNQLSKAYQSVPVIQDLSFSLNAGERLAIFAPSGAGKTTLLRILAGLERADQGEFTLQELVPVVLFQEPRLFPFLTLEQNIFLPFEAQQRKITPQIRKAFQHWLEVCDLAECTRLYPWQCSGGMKQKAAIIRAMLGSPRLVLLDEPFQSIGGEAKSAVINHLVQTNPDLSALFITHIPDEIPLLAHSVLFFHQQQLTHPLVIPAEKFMQENFAYPLPTHLMQQAQTSAHQPFEIKIY
jgi:ABC-type nitrate/sulfonate/bicarbonate transport system ATPase subunit